jgi:hypothetical protein
VGELTNVKFIFIIVCHTKDYLSNDQQGQLARRYLRIYSIWKIPDVVQNHFLMAIVYLAHDARRVVLIATLSHLPPGGGAKQCIGAISTQPLTGITM